MSERIITRAPAARRRGPSMSQRERRLAYTMLLPTIIIVVLIVILPVLWNLWISFRTTRLIDLQRANFWTLDLTLRNYQTVLSGRNFWPIFGTTLIYTIGSSLLAILGGLAAA